MLILNKDYMIFQPQVKTTNSGKEYVQFTVADGVPVEKGKYKNEYYRIKVFSNGDLFLEDRQKVKFTSFFMISCYTTVDANGKAYFNKDIYATIKGYNDVPEQESNDDEEVDIDEALGIEPKADIKPNDLPF